MIRKPAKYFSVIAAVFFSLSSCNINSAQPDNFNFDFRNLKSEKGGTLIFPADFNDSSSYTISIITRLSYRGQDSVLPLKITFISPSEETFSENIILQTDYARIKGYIKNHPDDKRISMADCSKYYDVIREYRTEVRPQENGIWKISVVLPKDRDKLMGIGLSAKKNPGK